MIAARVAGHAAESIGRMKGTELECSVAGVVGWMLATNDAPPSTEDIRAACAARMGRRPSYGTVVRVLTMLQACCVLDWQKAHVRRHHGSEVPEGAIVPVRQVNHDGSRCFKLKRYLLPVRRLGLVGFALTIVSGGVAAVALSTVSDARATLGSRVQPARADSPDPEKRALDTRSRLSVECAPRAESGEDSDLGEVGALFATLKLRPPGS